MMLELMNSMLPTGYIVGCRWVPELDGYRYAIAKRDPEHMQGATELLGEYDSEEACLCMCKLLISNGE
jgi:hypothetical protein